jgi:hypothetical protein
VQLLVANPRELGEGLQNRGHQQDAGLCTADKRSGCLHDAGIVRRASRLAEGLPEGATEWDLSGLTLDGQPFEKDTAVQVRFDRESCSSNNIRPAVG